MDNLSAGRSQDVADLPIDLRVGDIRDQAEVGAAMEGFRVVVHLAAHTLVTDSLTHPEINMETNVIGTVNLLQTAVRHKVERFILVSTGG